MSAGFRKYLTLFIKSAITVGVIGYLYHHLSSSAYELSDIWQLSWIPAICSAAMIPLNLGLEALKWRTMVRNFYPSTRFRDACEAVLAGMTTGIFTPNRIGEYGGRIFLLPPGKRVEAAVLMFVDRICQMMVTLWMGAIALAGFVLLKTDWDTGGKLLAILAIVLISGLLIWLAFSRNYVIRLLSRYRRYKYLRKAHTTLEQLYPGLLGRVLLLSTLRYLVFTLQFVLLMYAYGYHQGFFMAVWMILLIYLLKSFAPSIALSELGIRETIAIAVMNEFQVSQIISFNATFLLYLYNMALPSVLGMYLLPRMRIFGKRT